MLNILILAGVGLLIPTAYAAKIGAPYAPTFIKAVKEAFDYVKLDSSDTLVDIGAGDGKILIEASRRGATSYGYELSPFMWAVIIIRTIGNKKVKTYLKNFYKQSLSKDTTVIFAFLMPENMPRAKDYLSRQYLPNGKYFMSYTFPLKDDEPVKVIKADRCAPLYIYDLKKLTAKDPSTTNNNHE